MWLVVCIVSVVWRKEEKGGRVGDCKDFIFCASHQIGKANASKQQQEGTTHVAQLITSQQLTLFEHGPASLLLSTKQVGSELTLLQLWRRLCSEASLVGEYR